MQILRMILIRIPRVTPRMMARATLRMILIRIPRMIQRMMGIV